MDPLALDANCERLINEIESMPLLADRFEGMQHINRGVGCFSIVFKAFDRITQEHVVLKFYKITAELLANRLRMEGFENEPNLLAHLVNKDRCLQLIQNMHTYTLQIPQGGGTPIKIPCAYFVTEWLDGDVKDYFYNDKRTDALMNLEAFRNLLLAVNILHANRIAHRDLKEDNFRLAKRKSKEVAVAIDLGTGVFTEDGKQNGKPYAGHKGCYYYASPEAIAGLSVIRSFAVATDIYALGCMLFEIFNSNYHFDEFQSSNPLYETHIAAMRAYLPEGEATDKQMVDGWNDGLRHFSRHFNPIRITADGHKVPQAVWQELNDLMQAMTHIDHRQRISLEKALHKLDRCIKCVRDQRLASRLALIKRERRQRRVELQVDKDKRMLARQNAVSQVHHEAARS